MPKRRYARDDNGRFASGSGSSSSAKKPQGKGAPSNAYLNKSRKPMSVGEHRAFVRKKIAEGSMTKESHAAVMKQSRETGRPIGYRTELGPLRKPSNRVKLGNGYTARSRIVTGKTVNGKFVPNENPPKWSSPARPRKKK